MFWFCLVPWDQARCQVRIYLNWRYQYSMKWPFLLSDMNGGNYIVYYILLHCAMSCSGIQKVLENLNSPKDSRDDYWYYSFFSSFAWGNWDRLIENLVWSSFTLRPKGADMRLEFTLCSYPFCCSLHRVCNWIRGYLIMLCRGRRLVHRFRYQLRCAHPALDETWVWWFGKRTSRWERAMYVSLIKKGVVMKYTQHIKILP